MDIQQKTDAIPITTTVINKTAISTPSNYHHSIATEMSYSSSSSATSKSESEPATASASASQSLLLSKSTLPLSDPQPTGHNVAPLVVDEASLDAIASIPEKTPSHSQPSSILFSSETPDGNDNDDSIVSFDTGPIITSLPSTTSASDSLTHRNVDNYNGNFDDRLTTVITRQHTNVRTKLRQRQRHPHLHQRKQQRRLHLNRDRQRTKTIVHTVETQNSQPDQLHIQNEDGVVLDSFVEGQPKTQSEYSQTLKVHADESESL